MTRDFLSWRKQNDEHESLRLDLVGLAAEVATLSTRIDEALAEIDSPQAPALGATRQALADRALSVLAPQTTFQGVSTERLQTALGFLREDRRRMLELREEVEGVITQWALCDFDLDHLSGPSAAQPSPWVAP